jgi:hypothetical protein
MRDYDPFDVWFIRTSNRYVPSDFQEALVLSDLDELEAWLDSPPESRRREMPLVHGGRFSSARIDPAELPRAQELYRRVVAASGSRKTYAEEALLSLVACALDPAAIPFFVEMLGLAPPRDKHAAQRRQYSLAALALLAYQRDDPDALAALTDATRHPHPQARALAAYYLRVVYIGSEDLDLIVGEEQEAEESEEEQDRTPRRPIPPQLAERMAAVATNDPAFEPRFMARAFLRDGGQDVPLDNPGGAYALKVKFKHAKRIYRTIETRSEQTLEDLHLAIQAALGWDNDHLYSFYLNGKRGDERYRFASPWEEDAPLWTDDGVIGELGLSPKHTFLYLFDYGDQHEFEIEVVGIRAQAEKGEYPRVVDSKGDAPAQYWYADEDGESDE